MAMTIASHTKKCQNENQDWFETPTVTASAGAKGQLVLEVEDFELTWEAGALAAPHGAHDVLAGRTSFYHLKHDIPLVAVAAPRLEAALLKLLRRTDKDRVTIYGEAQIERPKKGVQALA